MISSKAITDYEREQFLRKLDVAGRAKNGLLISTWEWKFIGSYLTNARPSLWFTEPRRVSTDKMRMKYGSEPEIAMPFPPAEASSAKLPEAEAGCCQFIVREDGRQQPCNAPAAWRRQNGFRYCEEHAEAVQRDLKRRGVTMNLIEL